MTRSDTSVGIWTRGVAIAVTMWVTAAQLQGQAAMPALPDHPVPQEVELAPGPETGVVGSDEQLRTTIRDGYDRSPTFRTLVDHLVDHRTTVHIHQVPGLTAGLDACLLHRVAVADDGARLMWVFVRHNEPSDLLISLIAHELQHVHEVLDADVQAGPEMERVFQRLGERVGSSGRTRNYAAYETHAALDVQDLVKQELRVRRSGRANAR